MEDGKRIIPSPRGDYVELGRTQAGRLFKKHILTEGDLIHPVTKEVIPIDSEFVGKLQSNFEAGVCDIVQLPLANDDNQHVESPDRNLGQVIGLQREGDKLYAMCDFRKGGEDVGKTLLGASAFLHTNYVDTRTGEAMGPTLLHVAVTNRPYVTGLEDYSEIIAATAANTGETVLLTPPKEPKMTKEELLKALKEEHGIDVEALKLSATTEAAPDNKVLIKALTDAGVIKLTAGQTVETVSLTNQDVVDAVAELASDNVKLSQAVTATREQVAALTTDKVTAEVDGLVRQGRVLPAQRDAMLELALTNREIFDKMVPATPLIKLSSEVGHTAPIEQAQPGDDEIAAAIGKYTGPGGAAEKGGYIRASRT
jgi:Mu-like prophage I protein